MKQLVFFSICTTKKLYIKRVSKVSFSKTCCGYLIETPQQGAFGEDLHVSINLVVVVVGVGTPYECRAMNAEL